MSAETHSFLQRAWMENPFDSDVARTHSDYTGYAGGGLARLLESAPVRRFSRMVNDVLRSFILDPSFSCLGAKSALRRESYRFGTYARLGDADVTEGLARDLFAFVAERRGFESEYTTFVAVFRESPGLDEAEFENALWSQLQSLHELDAKFHAWDPRVASDPQDAGFSFSFGGTAFFIVGLHPNSSRAARRFPWPALVFNAHEQFEQLREVGAFSGLQKQIRKREVALDGSINANLADYGTHSEARQYSGRATEGNWTCPFRVVTETGA